MTDRPILFSAPMVRALLAGTKTQTRRLVKPQFGRDAEIIEEDPVSSKGWQMSGHSGVWRDEAGDPFTDMRRCPYGVPGDVLWVKETHRFDFAYDGLKPTEMPDTAAVFYSADDAKAGDGFPGKVRVSLHMQRRFSRLALRITDIRVERLNDISEADALAEGLTWTVPGKWAVDRTLPIIGDDPRLVYRDLWDHINGAGAWAANPWVWALSFEIISTALRAP